MEKSQWIRSPIYDLIFFSTLWWIPLGILILQYHSMAYMAVLFVLYHLLLRIPHFVATLNFTYLFEKNKNYYRENWIRFYLIPISIFLVYATRRLFNGDSFYSKTLFSIALIWGTQHFAFQNYGILSLYRSRSEARKDLLAAKLEKIVFSELVVLAIYKAVLQFWMKGLIDGSQDEFIKNTIYSCVGLTLLVYFFRLWSIRKTSPASKPAFLFFLTAIAVTVYWPFYDTIASDASVGANIYFYVINGHHCLAYLGLIHHMNLNENKLSASTENPKRFLLPIVIGTFALMGFVLIKWYLNGDPLTLGSGFKSMSILEGIFVTHYYLESNTWKFSNPHTRETLAPLLKS